MLLILGWAGAQAAYNVALERGWSRTRAGRGLPGAEVAALLGAMLGYTAGACLAVLMA